MLHVGGIQWWQDVSLQMVMVIAVTIVIERFHSRGQHLCKLIGTKKSVCIRKEVNSHRTDLGHQHSRHLIVLGHQYGRRDVMWKHSILVFSIQSNPALRTPRSTDPRLIRTPQYYGQFALSLGKESPHFLSVSVLTGLDCTNTLYICHAFWLVLNLTWLSQFKTSRQCLTLYCYRCFYPKTKTRNSQAYTHFKQLRWNLQQTCHDQFSHKPITTLRRLLANVKDKDRPEDRQGALYKIKCCDCRTIYIGETGGNLSTRLTEHKRATRNGDVNNHIGEHHLQAKHQIDRESGTCITYSTDYYKRFTFKAGLLT